MSEPDQGAAAGTANARPESPSLFIVERRLPKISEHQLAVLQAVECDLVQGYLFGGALSADEMGERLSSGVLV